MRKEGAVPLERSSSGTATDRRGSERLLRGGQLLDLEAGAGGGEALVRGRHGLTGLGAEGARLDLDLFAGEGLELEAPVLAVDATEATSGLDLEVHQAAALLLDLVVAFGSLEHRSSGAAEDGAADHAEGLGPRAGVAPAARGRRVRRGRGLTDGGGGQKRAGSHQGRKKTKLHLFILHVKIYQQKRWSLLPRRAGQPGWRI